MSFMSNFLRLSSSSFHQLRPISMGFTCNSENRLIHIEKQFESIPPLERNKETFMAAVAMFKDKRSRNHVEFINSALKYVKEYGIHKDLDTYKALLNVFPKGKMIPQNTFQKLFLHYPMQQNCCVKVLDEMEWHGVHPDKESHDIVVNAFGEWNFATKKVKRMLYWMPKLKHSNKYLDRRLVEGKSLTDAQLASVGLRMICRDPGTVQQFVKVSTNSSLDLPAWIISAQSVQQKMIINKIPVGTEVFVDGPFSVHVFDRKMQYVVMTCGPLNNGINEFRQEEADEDFSRWFTQWESQQQAGVRTIHEQRHETILAVAAFCVNDNKTANHWLHQLQLSCPRLSEMNIRIRLDKGQPQFRAADSDEQFVHADRAE